ncbi:MAG: roadblock/LC7 domain-containing protein [Promethearchaeota archaeon]
MNKCIYFHFSYLLILRYHPENVEKFLFSLQNTNSAIKGVILLSVEGLPIASTLPRGINKSQLSALSATILAVGKRGNNEMDNGEFNYLHIKGSKGGVLVFQLSKFEVVVILTTENVKLETLLKSVNNFQYEGHMLFHLEHE